MERSVRSEPPPNGPVKTAKEVEETPGNFTLRHRRASKYPSIKGFQD